MNGYQISGEIGKKLRKKGLKLATAESCTGGLIGHLLTQISGSSDYFLGGLISYSNDVKNSHLKVSQSTLKRFGAVSPQTAKAMALGARKSFKSDVALATTGIAGPLGGTRTKPVGLVYLGIAGKKGSLTEKKIFKGSRLQIKKQAAEWALKRLWVFIKNG